MFSVDVVLDYVKRTFFFAVAFLPLWIIVTINYIFSEFYNFFGMIGAVGIIIALPIFFRLYLNKCYEHTTYKYFKVKKRKDITHEFIFYAISYMPISMIQSFDYLHGTMIFLVIIGLVGLLYIKTDMLHVNPVLTLMGYKTYKIEDDHQNMAIFFSKLVVRNDVDIPFTEISYNVNLILDR